MLTSSLEKSDNKFNIPTKKNMMISTFLDEIEIKS